MGVFLHLAAGHGHQAIPVLFGQQFAHLLGAAGVQPLTNDQERIVLVIRRGAVDRGRGRFVAQGRAGVIGVLNLGWGSHRTWCRLEFGGQFSQGADMGRRGAATPADHLHPQILHEVQQLHPHLQGGEPVMGHTSDVFRQAGVGNATHHKGTVLAEIANVLLHLLRTRGAIEAQHVDGEWLQNRHNGGDVRTHQHRAGGFHRHAHHQGAALASFAKGGLDALQGCLDLQHVLAGFHDEQIHIAGQQALGLLGERGLHDIEIDVAQRGQLGGWPHRSGHEARLIGGGKGISDLTGQLGGTLVDREGLILQVIFGQHNRGSPEGVGLDHIATHLQKLAVHSLHHIRPGEHQVFVAALQGQTAEIVGAQIHLLQRRARGPVKHQHRTLRAVQSLQKSHARLDGGAFISNAFFSSGLFRGHGRGRRRKCGHLFARHQP